MSSLVQCVTLADRRLQVLEGTDFLSWEPYKLPGDSPKHLPNRYRLNPRLIPGGTQQMLVHLKADTRNQCFLPGQVEELYDFYQWKIKEDIALERSLVGLLDHVPSLAALSVCCYGRSGSSVHRGRDWSHVRLSFE